MKSTTRKLTILSFALAFGLIACPAFAATETWSDGIGDWFDGSNWSTGMVPAATDEVFINNGGTAQIMSAGAVGADLGLGVGASESGTLVLSGSGTLTLDNATFLEIGGEGAGTLTINAGSTVTHPTNAFIGTFAGSTGTVTVNGGTWNNSGQIQVGSSGTGVLTIQNGGTVNNFNPNGSFIGTFAGSTGTATVDGPGSTWTCSGLIVYDGRLRITNGGVITSFGAAFIAGAPPGTGVVTVDGPGSIWANSTAVDFDLGPLAGTTGTLNVTNGAVFSVDDATMYVGGQSGGPVGTGRLRIADGGSVSAPSIIIWSTGTLEIGANPIVNITGGGGELAFFGGVLRAIADTNLTPDTYFFQPGGLIVDSNGFTCTLSGVLPNPTGAAPLTKINSGTLVLTNGNNSYEGGTIVTAGILSVLNETGSATGIGPVQVNAGTLSGSGIISGAVALGTGNGAGAFLAPGQGAAKPVTLTMQNSLTLKADATYKWKLNTKRAGADKVIANGVTIESGASFTFKGAGEVALTPGTIFTVIDNTAATPIAGTFSNLADGSIFTANGNNFQANYEGGDGNDLTLTVVP